MKVVGISACPAGLAHTPMAAKALEKVGVIHSCMFDMHSKQPHSLKNPAT